MGVKFDIVFKEKFSFPRMIGFASSEECVTVSDSGDVAILLDGQKDNVVRLVWPHQAIKSVSIQQDF